MKSLQRSYSGEKCKARGAAAAFRCKESSPFLRWLVGVEGALSLSSATVMVGAGGVLSVAAASLPSGHWTPFQVNDDLRRPAAESAQR